MGQTQQVASLGYSHVVTQLSSASETYTLAPQYSWTPIIIRIFFKDKPWAASPPGWSLINISVCIIRVANVISLSFVRYNYFYCLLILPHIITALHSLITCAPKSKHNSKFTNFLESILLLLLPINTRKKHLFGFF